VKLERWKKIEELYGALLEQPEEKQAAFLSQACGEDQELHREIESMLEARRAGGSVPGKPIAEQQGPALERKPGKSSLVGKRLGLYEVEELIGAGGMGEVYRARDTRLRRAVALKVLPAEYSFDPEKVARLEREARMLAALNHPHIAAIHALEEWEGRQILVMELVEGQTLAKRLQKGPLSLEQTLDMAAQIADALDAAHKQGIVHRDLKPGNVMLTKAGAKLLDFGLATLKRRGEKRVGAETAAPTESASITESGTILGTVPYMAPEQLEGRPVDARTDIWALGVMLYEMITGRRAFEGSSQASLIAAILTVQPAPLLTIQPLTPPLFDHVVKRCLTKSADDRWDSAHDVAEQLRWIRGSGGPAATITEKARGIDKWKWAAIGSSVFAALALAIIAIFVWMSRSEHPQPIVRTIIPVSTWGLSVTEGGLAISPDGQTLAFTARGADQSLLYLRHVNEWEPRPLKGTEGANFPVFSPDGGWVAYSVDSKGIYKIPVRGGPPQLICTVNETNSETWSSTGEIIFGGSYWNPGVGLWRVSADGGTPRPLTRTPGTTGGVWHMAPSTLPSTRDALFTIWREGHASVAAVSLRTGEVRQVIDSGSNAHYLSATGDLIYESEGHLFAVPFDPERLEKRGGSRVVIEGIATGGFGAPYDLSLTGTLAYLPSSNFLTRLVWKDRSGSTTPLKLDSRRYYRPTLSQDGRHLADTIQEGPVRNLWIGNVDGEPLTRLTFGNDDCCSLFTQDGKWVWFTSGQNGQYNIFRTPADGSGKAERLTNSPRAQKATSLSPHGDVFLFNTVDDFDTCDIWQSEVGQPGSARPFVTTRFSEMNGVFSPDGRWVAYSSNESGRYEVYVQAYPGPGAKTQVSINGGQAPAWNPRGGELFYQAPSALMAVQVENGIRVGPPTKLFAHTTPREVRDWDVSPDGQRFLVIEPAEERGSLSQINIISNWFEELKRRTPTDK
jgi:serine/threonine protein kinase